MKLLLDDNFYSVKTVVKGQNTVVTIILNPAHRIYKGHFPEMAVTPGVCLIEILREILCDLTGRNLRLKEASNIKFMAIVNPKINNELNVDCQYIVTSQGIIKSKMIIYFDKTVFMKFDGMFA